MKLSHIISIVEFIGASFSSFLITVKTLESRTEKKRLESSLQINGYKFLLSKSQLSYSCLIVMMTTMEMYTEKKSTVLIFYICSVLFCRRVGTTFSLHMVITSHLIPLKKG